jgi:hypothetical protein
VMQSDVWSNEMAARRLFEHTGFARVCAWRQMTLPSIRH